ncbi:MAG: OmpA family protein [Magnetococcus sp. YQC-5]
MKKIVPVFVILLGWAYPAGAVDSCNQADTLFKRSQQHPQDEEKQLLKILTLCPNHVRALNNLAGLAEQRGAMQEAEDYYRKIMQIEPTFAPAHAGMGDVSTARKDYRMAADYYAAFLEMVDSQTQAASEDNLAQYRPMYQAKLEAVQNKINPDTLVSAQDIIKSLTVATKKTRGIQNIAPAKSQSLDITIRFLPGSDELEQRSFTQLQQVVTAFEAPRLALAHIRIVSHADREKTVDYIRNLSLRRAKKVQQIFVQQFHLAEDRIDVEGEGTSRPGKSQDTPDIRITQDDLAFVNIKWTGN